LIKKFGKRNKSCDEKEGWRRSRGWEEKEISRREKMKRKGRRECRNNRGRTNGRDLEPSIFYHKVCPMIGNYRKYVDPNAH
jgi:hypothetical protein